MVVGKHGLLGGKQREKGERDKVQQKVLAVKLSRDFFIESRPHGQRYFYQLKC